MDGSGTWFSNEDDPTVDLAVRPFHFNAATAGFDMLNIPQDMFLTSDKLYDEDVGIGDLCYTMGLFRLLAGKKRNLPIVHTGNIALLPGDEKIPVNDWLKPFDPNARVLVEGFLIESQALNGLSGSPVLVWPCVDMIDLRTLKGKALDVRWAKAHPFLLGIWQGSWDAKPDEVAAIEHGNPVRVPVGIGVVVPVTKLIDILELPTLAEMRNKHREQRAHAESATLD